jgi:methyltransferase (TIGR00027 family)
MQENQASRTAWGAAFYRAFHHRHDQPKLFDDPLAQHLLPDVGAQAFEERALKLYGLMDPEAAAAQADRAQALRQAMRVITVPAHVLSRARYTEESLEQAMAQGARQYVILGAGLDTFAFRRPGLMENLEVFEVDHPDTQAHKRQRLEQLGWPLPAGLHFVPVDFTRQGLAQGLARSSYDPGAPSFFGWMGVTYYLPMEAVRGTLAAIAGLAPRGSSVVFDYRHEGAQVSASEIRRHKVMREVLRRAGEPLVSSLEPQGLAELLAGLGLILQEDLGAAQIEERYFSGRDDGYHASQKIHYAWAWVA